MKKYLLYLLFGFLILISFVPVHELGHFIVAKMFHMEILNVVWYKFALAPSLGTGSVTVMSNSIPSVAADYLFSMGGPVLETWYCVFLILISLEKKWWWMLIPAQMTFSYIPIFSISDIHKFYPLMYKNALLIYGFLYGSLLVYVVPFLNREEWLPDSMLNRDFNVKIIIERVYKDEIHVKPSFLHEYGDPVHHWSMVRTCEFDADGSPIRGTGPSNGMYAIHESLDLWVFYPVKYWLSKHFEDSKTYEILRNILGFFWGLNCGFPFRDVTLATLWSFRDCAHKAVFEKKDGKWVNKYPNSTLMGFK